MYVCMYEDEGMVVQCLASLLNKLRTRLPSYLNVRLPLSAFQVIVGYHLFLNIPQQICMYIHAGNID